MNDQSPYIIVVYCREFNTHTPQPIGIYVGSSASPARRFKRIDSCPDDFPDSLFADATTNIHLFKLKRTAKMVLTKLINNGKLHIEDYSFKVQPESELVAMML
jgi:hypothetical protein